MHRDNFSFTLLLPLVYTVISYRQWISDLLLVYFIHTNNTCVGELNMSLYSNKYFWKINIQNEDPTHNPSL